MEYYDYGIYGSAAAVALPKVFFPTGSTETSLLLSFATFGVGFVLRPLGGIIFGHVGDRFGRKPALIATITLMAIGTLLIGLIPGFSVLGVWAPILLVIFRLAQGAAIGGEMGGATSLIVENAPAERRGFFSALMVTGSPLAGLISAGLFTLVSLNEPFFLQWGWRIPFLFSIVILIVGLVIRSRLSETRVFVKKARENALARVPLVEAFRQPRWPILAIIIGLAEAIPGYAIGTYGLAFLAGHGVPPYVGFVGGIIGSAINLFLVPTYGAISDRVGRKPVFIFGCAALIVIIYPVYLLMGTHNIVLIWVAYVGGQLLTGSCLVAIAQTLFAELFPTEVRYTGVSIGYQFSNMLGGGFTPLIAVALTGAAGGAAWPVAAFVAAIGLASLIAVLTVPERAKKPLLETDVASAEAVTAK
ncbi:MAG: MFS transporter [Candidatus Dormibacteraceae bacterium]